MLEARASNLFTIKSHFSVAATKVDGKAWVKNTDGSQVYRLDVSTGEYENLGSFKTPEFIALARKFAIPVVFTDHATYPNIADVTGDFVYARLQQGEDTIPTAYPPKELAAWSKRLRTWAAGAKPHARASSTRSGRSTPSTC